MNQYYDDSDCGDFMTIYLKCEDLKRRILQNRRTSGISIEKCIFYNQTIEQKCSTKYTGKDISNENYIFFDATI